MICLNKLTELLKLIKLTISESSNWLLNVYIGWFPIPTYSPQNSISQDNRTYYKTPKILSEWIAAGEVPEYKLFTEEPKAKRTRRHNKYRKEALEARQIKEEMEAKNSAGSLEQQIMARQKSRGTSLLDQLMAKYGGDDKEDDSELFDFDAELKKKAGTKKTSKKKENVKEPVHKVKNGRVIKTRSSK